MVLLEEQIKGRKGDLVKEFKDYVRPIMYKMRCEKDGCKGELEKTGNAFHGAIHSYDHKCTLCDRIVSIQNNSYPRLTYETIRKKRETYK